MTNYQQKLHDFNQTKKYRQEIEFLNGILPKGKILDYGCGVGTGAIMLRTKGRDIDGFDITRHTEDFDYQDDIERHYNGVYFMHSLAHLNDPHEVLKQRRRFLLGNARVVVITPNLDWLNAKGRDNYKPDETVVQHFCQYRLEQLFIDSGYSIVNSGQFGARLGNNNERLFLIAEKNKYKTVR